MENEVDIAGRIQRIELELESIKQYYEKSVSYSENNDPAAALWMARKAAEAICSELFQATIGKPPKNASLDVLIEKLVNQDAIPKKIQVPLRTIQTYGNFGTHHQGRSTEPITHDYAQPCLQALATVVRWYFDENGQPPPKSEPSPRVASPVGRKPLLRLLPWMLAGTLAACAALAGFLLYRTLRGSPKPLSPPPVAQPPEPNNAPGSDTTVSTATADTADRPTRLAVLPFRSNAPMTPEAASIADELTSTLTSRVLSSRLVSVVERDQLDKVLGELELSRTAQFNQNEVARIGRLLGARQLLIGSFYRDSKAMRVDARIVDTETGDVVAAAIRKGTSDDDTALIEMLASDIVDALKRNSAESTESER